jgi:small-conductance mechanosensitive channel
VYDSPAEAITALLAVKAAVGSQQLTVGLVVVAIASLGISYLVSWMVQKLLTEHVLARRNLVVSQDQSDPERALAAT